MEEGIGELLPTARGPREPPFRLVPLGEDTRAGKSRDSRANSSFEARSSVQQKSAPLPRPRGNTPCDTGMESVQWL